MHWRIHLSVSRNESLEDTASVPASRCSEYLIPVIMHGEDGRKTGTASRQKKKRLPERFARRCGRSSLQETELSRGKELSGWSFSADMD